MKLQVLCDCDDNKLCVGNWNGEPIWHFRKHYDVPSDYENVFITNFQKLNDEAVDIKKQEWKKNDEWFKDEAYKQNSD